MTSKALSLGYIRYYFILCKECIFERGYFLERHCEERFFNLIIVIYKKIATWQSRGSGPCASGSIKTDFTKCEQVKSISFFIVLGLLQRGYKAIFITLHKVLRLKEIGVARRDQRHKKQSSNRTHKFIKNPCKIQRDIV